jgi:phage terminase Nu1 subunit (DNA packaging protein)
MGQYQTAEQLADTIGGITPRTVRTLRAQGLPAVKLGKAWLFDPEKALAWIAAREEAQCPVQTEVRTSSSSVPAASSTSSGAKPAASASVALARQTAERLKRRSRSSSGTGTGKSDQPGRVIQASFR